MTRTSSVPDPHRHPQISDSAFEYFRAPGEDYLSPIKFAKTFSLDRTALARLLSVSPATLRQHPEAAQVQAGLARFVIVYSALLDTTQDVDPVRAAFHFRNTPLRAFGYRTLFEEVEAGNDEGALGFVHSIASGYVG